MEQVKVVELTEEVWAEDKAVTPVEERWVEK